MCKKVGSRTYLQLYITKGSLAENISKKSLRWKFPSSPFILFSLYLWVAHISSLLGIEPEQYFMNKIVLLWGSPNEIGCHNETKGITRLAFPFTTAA